MDDSPVQIRTPRLDLKIELARKRAEAERKAARHVPMTGEGAFEKTDHQPDTLESLKKERDKYKAFAEFFAARCLDARLIVDIEPQRDEVIYVLGSSPDEGRP